MTQFYFTSEKRPKNKEWFTYMKIVVPHSALDQNWKNAKSCEK